MPILKRGLSICECVVSKLFLGPQRPRGTKEALKGFLTVCLENLNLIFLKNVCLQDYFIYILSFLHSFDMVSRFTIESIFVVYSILHSTHRVSMERTSLRQETCKVKQNRKIFPSLDIFRGVDACAGLFGEWF